ncbi:MAG: hypothetical protein KJ721_02435 [Nanoarchaeota archaeon]|nr:hypothetical protein [Nanoarchaeota archaeon]
MRQIISKLSNRTLYTFITLLILATGFLIVNAYGTSNPAVVGHSAGEIVEADPTVLASVKDGVSWSEISSMPAGFADGVDDAGSTVSSLPWSSITGKPAGFADGVDDVGISYTYGNLIIHSNTGEVTKTSAGMTKLKESVLDVGGDLTITFNGKPQCCWSSFAIYKNGAQVGPIHSNTGFDYLTWTDNIAGWSVGDRVQVYGEGGCSGCGRRESSSLLQISVNGGAKIVQ